MENKFKNGDPVRFDWDTEQIEKESEFKIPFTVSKTEKKDLYSSGLPMDCWENIVTVVDASGDVVAETEEGELILLDAPQTVATVDVKKNSIDPEPRRDLEAEEIEELTDEEERDRNYEINNPDHRDNEYEEDTFDFTQIGL